MPPPSLYGAILKLQREVDELEAASRRIEAKLDAALTLLNRIVKDVEPQPAVKMVLTLGKEVRQ